MALLEIQALKFRTVVAATQMCTFLGPGLRLEDNAYLEPYFSIWEEQEGCADSILRQGLSIFFKKESGFDRTQAHAM